ncbi:hypothetical protein MLD38_015914 [Melastoma candidum]|uniref:Uncharacterized protein n=1 Tax=Melastoma candidum TaxID=119954 RepID=A0ACB9RHW0_9MYRT|nr:hypothetical protein MLD38_015914 [Melastoma candidum]
MWKNVIWMLIRRLISQCILESNTQFLPFFSLIRTIIHIYQTGSAMYKENLMQVSVETWKSSSKPTASFSLVWFPTLISMQKPSPLIDFAGSHNPGDELY